MAQIAMAAMVVGTVLQTLGQVQAGRAQAAAGRAEQQALELRAAAGRRTAEALEQEAGQERARSQRDAFDEARQGRLVASRARAVSAASGAALDPSIFGDIDLEAETRVFERLAEGEDVGRGLEFRGALARAGAEGDVFAGQIAKKSGQAAAQRSYLSAAGSLLSGGTSIYDRYKETAVPSQNWWNRNV